MSRQQPRDLTDDYSVRWFESGDRSGFLSLCDVQWDWTPTADWFDWKYVEDPYLSHVPITVAERDGEIVGAQGYLPCRIRRGEMSVLALQPTDAVVHPDHRRNGLYTRITKQAIDRYTDGDPAFFFNFPNESAFGAQQKLGWVAVDEVTNYYRLQRPAEVLDSVGVGSAARALGRAADSVASAYLGARDLSASVAEDVDVTTHSTVPAQTLASLYDSAPPAKLHVHRDSQFYRWTFDAPNYDHTTYVARREGRPIGALTTRTRDGKKVLIADALPPNSHSEAFTKLLAVLLEDNEDANIIAVSDSTLPRELLAKFGFVSDERPLLSRVCVPKYMAVRPLSRVADSTPFSPAELTDEDCWRVTFVEQMD
ncbi:GNAT family N-acetyltransferase [Halorussus halophilus]|uniref:GNAT family N-acetyltransferase n=1 Tax=Halorussus halophilus TaxID=2650975 RepID=UPI0013015717|nr:GNAT family N-acetyltransferase [Halorussus halophilus]